MPFKNRGWMNEKKYLIIQMEKKIIELSDAYFFLLIDKFDVNDF